MVEQRKSERTKLNKPVSVWHQKACRYFNGHSDNISRNGVLLTLPMKTPLRQGQSLEVNFPQSDSPEEVAEKEDQPKRARVIRIDREDMVHSATIKVGLEFCGQAQ